MVEVEVLVEVVVMEVVGLAEVEVKAVVVLKVEVKPVRLQQSEHKTILKKSSVLQRAPPQSTVSTEYALIVKQ